MATLAILVVLLSGFVTVIHAADRDVSSGVPLPVIPMGKGTGCVKDTEFMRRNHMDLLKHQREDTMLEGKRGEAFSLKECISCHAVYGPDEQALSAASPQHFCRSCHDYAAVNIDCFQCHASRPENENPDSVHPFQIAGPGTTTARGPERP